MREVRAESLLYTNAAGTDGRGFRVVEHPSTWAADDISTAEDWIRGLEIEPGPGASAADQASSNPTPPLVCAFACLPLGGGLRACLAVLVEDFAPDADRREGGLLIHLLALPVADGEDPALHAAALVRLGRDLLRRVMESRNASDPERLETYRRAVSDLPAALLLPPSLAALGDLLRAGTLGPLLRSVADRALEVKVESPPGHPLPESVAAASGALPPRLRLAWRWSCGLRPAERLTRVRRGRVRPLRGPGVGETAAYEAWLRQSLAGPSPDAPSPDGPSPDSPPPGAVPRVREVLTDWEIRSWRDLSRRLEESMRT